MIFATILPYFLGLWALFNVLDISSGLPFDDASHFIPSSDLVKRDTDKNCVADESFIERRVTVGHLNDGHGSHFCAAKWLKGTFPKQIEARASNKDLRYIKITYTDGSEEILGTHKYTSDKRAGTVTWDPWSDTFDKFSLYEGGWKGALGRIVLQTTNKCNDKDTCRLDAGAYWKNPPPERQIPRGANSEGMLLGFEGSDGDVIDGLRPIFSKTRPDRVRLTDAEFSPSFEELNERPFEQRMMEAVQDDYIMDNSRESEDIEMSADLVLITEERIAMSRTDEGGFDHAWEIGGSIKAELSFPIGFPEIDPLKGGVEFNPKYVKTSYHKVIRDKTDTQVKRVQTRYGLKTNVKAGQMAKCTVTAIQSKVNLRYKATLEQIFRDGSSYKYPVQGQFENSQSSQAIAHCEDLDPKEASKLTNVESGPVISKSGTYCPDGTRVGDVGMSDEQLMKACGVDA